MAVPRAFRRHQARVALGSLAIAIGITNFVIVSEIHDQADCQSRYNQSFTEARAAQITAADRERVITRDIIGGFARLYTAAKPVDPKRAREQTRQLFINYQNAAAAADAAREANPLPPTPNC